MNREQIETAKLKLSNRNCPICGGRILVYSNPSAPISQITSQEQSYFDEIDISQDYFDIECADCGYVMKFNKIKFFK